MFLLAYRSSKHETTGVTPAELCFARDLRLSLDLLRRSPPEFGENSDEDYVRGLKRKLESIHNDVRERMDLRSTRVKNKNNRGVKQVLFQEGQKVWLFNPRRVKGKAPKLQRNWEGPYEIVRKLSEVVFCIQKSLRHRKKVVHADRLAPYLVRQLESE